MKGKTEGEIITWLQQEFDQPFQGWDFSFLAGRRDPMGSLPWDYVRLAAHFLTSATALLDVDTGGGEILSKLLNESDFKGRACAVEAYAPNVSIARTQLKKWGVEVYDTSLSPHGFDDNTFDLVLDRHGGSIDPAEVHRILRPGGHMVTEQIGDRTNVELRELFDAEPDLRSTWPHNAKEADQVFSMLGFVTEQLTEYSYPVRFFDVGALAYYLKAIPWEVPGFSIQAHSEALLALHRESSRRGFAIDATYHAYFLVARKQ